MMVSFLAHLEGGVSATEEHTAQETGAQHRAVTARAGFRFPLAHLLGAELGAEGSSQRSEGSTFELKTERHHTAASLFNTLYSYLREDGVIIDLLSDTQLSGLRAGQLVEVAGEYRGNPLEEVLGFVSSLLPYVEAQREAEATAAEQALRTAQRGQRTPHGRTTPSRRDQDAQQAVITELATAAAATRAPGSAFGLQVMRRMAEDLAAAPVHDLLLETGSGLHVVITASSDFYSTETNEFLREGEFRAVGKVTRVITGDLTINLTRRTLLGAAGPEMAQGLMASVGSASNITLSVGDPIVSAPAVQVLPMAIFL